MCIYFYLQCFPVYNDVLVNYDVVVLFCGGMRYCCCFLGF
jgi:hypothetical protein